MAFNLLRYIQGLIKPPKNPYSIPVIINSYNRLTYLQLQINWLLQVGMTNIHILDNASSYPPLLDYYKRLPPSVTVHYLGKNLGYKALWKSRIYNKFRWNYYIYTDPDIVPTESCPLDFITVFLDALNQYPDIGKVGFNLKIDDLPDCYHRKQEVIKWESPHFDENKKRGIFYEASIDTTFALYRPLTSRRKSHWKMKALRAGEPYIARHMPWYANSSEPTEEDIFYTKTGTCNNW